MFKPAILHVLIDLARTAIDRGVLKFMHNQARVYLKASIVWCLICVAMFVADIYSGIGIFYMLGVTAGFFFVVDFSYFGCCEHIQENTRFSEREFDCSFFFFGSPLVFYSCAQTLVLAEPILSLGWENFK